MSDKSDLNIDLTASEAMEMLQNKIAELNAANAEIISIKSRSLKVYEENQMLQHSPEYAMQAANMKYQLEVARNFIKSGAYPNQTPEQLYVKIKAGKEMGMSESESVNSLYFIKGKLEPYGKGMISLVTSKGYRLTYVENKDTCELTATKGEEVYKETAHASDPIIKRSNAAKISLRNKLRFHAVRTLLNFQLPHLISGVPDLFESIHIDAQTNDDGNTIVLVSSQDLMDKIKGASSMDELTKIHQANKAAISKDIHLATALGAMKKQFQV